MDLAGFLICTPPFVRIFVFNHGRDRKRGKYLHDGWQEMNVRKGLLWLNIERVMPWLVLVIMLFYTYAKFFGHPYGFRWDPTGVIVYVFDKQPEPTFRMDDQIVQIGDITWEEFSKDLRKMFFVGVKPGDVIPSVVERNGEIVNIDWVYPQGPTRSELLDQLYSEWFIAYFFWLAGLLTILLIRPKDDRWLLMVLFNFLTALWLTAGSGPSSFHIWNSALVLRMAVLLSVPVYLHLHWTIPQPLGKVHPVFLKLLYIITLTLVVAQWFQLLPNNFYMWGFLASLVGSFILLIVHIVRQPSARRHLRLLFVATLLAIALAVIWQIFQSLKKIPTWLGNGGLLGLPLLPLAYLYSAFHRRLGDLELRANRFFSIYLFVILLAMVELPLIIWFEQIVQISGEVLAISLIATIVTAAAFIWVYPTFENFVERRIFGIPLPSKRLLEIYSNRITTSNILSDLVRVIDYEIIPSLLIRQFVFLQAEDGSIKVLSNTGVNEEQIPKAGDIPDLMTQTGVYLTPNPLSKDLPDSWIRLILPLKLGEEIIGFWLFGRRDPDDMYSQLEIPIIKSLANQTAVALSNLLQKERLKTMYEANIDRYEQEKLRLSRDLHDSILNELAALLMREDAPVFSPAFQEAFEALTERLREIVSDMRPPTLNFGLKVALEDLADKLSERNQDNAKIVTTVQADGDWRYPEKVENHLYRIVQEACENALKYAQAKIIRIVARLEQARVDIKIEDDGVGFNSKTSLKLDEMLVHKHFGLAGMHERAHLIGAEIHVHSRPGEGTRIQVIGEFKETI
jgi:signal transduction histidine kinase